MEYNNKLAVQSNKIQNFNLFNTEGLASARIIYKQLGYANWQDFEKLLVRVFKGSDIDLGSTISQYIANSGKATQREFKDYLLTQEQLMLVLEQSGKAEVQAFVREYNKQFKNNVKARLSLLLDENEKLRSIVNLIDSPFTALYADKRQQLKQNMIDIKDYVKNFSSACKDQAFRDLHNAFYEAFFGRNKKDLKLMYDLTKEDNLLDYLTPEAITNFNAFIKKVIKTIPMNTYFTDFKEKIRNIADNIKDYLDFKPLETNIIIKQDINKHLNITSKEITVKSKRISNFLLSLE